MADTEKHSNRWMWVSVVLGVAAVGLLVWAISVKSDLDSTQDDLDTTAQQLTSTKQQLDASEKKLAESQKKVEALESQEISDRRKRVGGAVLAAGGIGAVKAVYDDLSDELGATNEELETTQEDLEAANEEAEKASSDADAAKREADEAESAADKTEAALKQAQAEAKEAQSRGTVVADCARGYVSAFGSLFEGESVRDQAEGVRKQFADLTADCKGVLRGE